MWLNSIINFNSPGDLSYHCWGLRVSKGSPGTPESSRSPNAPQSCRYGNPIPSWTVACDSEVKRSYIGSARPLFSVASVLLRHSQDTRQVSIELLTRYFTGVTNFPLTCTTRGKRSKLELHLFPAWLLHQDHQLKPDTPECLCRTGNTNWAWSGLG